MTNTCKTNDDPVVLNFTRFSVPVDQVPVSSASPVAFVVPAKSVPQIVLSLCFFCGVVVRALSLPTLPVKELLRLLEM